MTNYLIIIAEFWCFLADVNNDEFFKSNRTIFPRISTTIKTSPKICNKFQIIPFVHFTGSALTWGQLRVERTKSLDKERFRVDGERSAYPLKCNLSGAAIEVHRREWDLWTFGGRCSLFINNCMLTHLQEMHRIFAFCS